LVYKFSVAIVLLSLVAQGEALNDVQVRIQVAKGLSRVDFSAAATISSVWGTENKALPAGRYTVSLAASRPPQLRYHVFAKTFLPSEEPQARLYMAEMRAKGYAPEIVIFGRKFSSGQATIDNRSLWISLARCETETQGLNVKARLQKESVWPWVWQERVIPGAGEFVLTDAQGKQARLKQQALKISCGSGISLAGVDTGYWSRNKKNLAFAGSLDIQVGPDGRMEVIENIGAEAYLKGVLPAEMPAQWPQEALRAQAVAARSEILANLSQKHMLDGFDFCATEHCRAYLGMSGREAPTDEAVSATQGLAMTYRGRFLPAVYCANCGGVTENNETVWSGPPNDALRAIRDIPGKSGTALNPVTEKALPALLKDQSAYCAGKRDNYRWSREFSHEQLSAAVNKVIPVGTVKSIVLGDRGPGGRLRWVKIVGTRATKTIEKELNIRTAFGGIPSAMFIIESKKDRFRLIGGGRGHGVGFCQDGARGMADRGIQHREILCHYFPRAQFESVHILGGK
jgi:SpoIID/LytB domain protein